MGEDNDKKEVEISSVDELNKLLEVAVNKGWGSHILSRTFDLAGYNKIDFTLISVVLTFEGLLPMTLVFRRQLVKEKDENRNSWLGMSDDEITTNVYEFNVRYFAELLEIEPVHLPNYPTIEVGSMKQRFITYFLDYENKALFRFVQSAWEKKQYPKELM